MSPHIDGIFAAPRAKLDASERVAYEYHALFEARKIAVDRGGERLGPVIDALRALCIMWAADYGVAAHRVIAQIGRDERSLKSLGLSGTTQDEWYLTRLLESRGEHYNYEI